MKRTLITTAAIVIATVLNTRAATPDTRLFDAVRANDLTQVRQLLASGAQIDAADANGNTALMVAAAHGYTDIARLLVDRGADVDARGYIGNTALIFAAQEGNAEIVQLLVDRGADPDARNQYGSSAPRLAVGWGHGEVAQVLNQSGDRPWLAGDGLGQKVLHTLIALTAIVAVPALTARAVYASVSTTHSHV